MLSKTQIQENKELFISLICNDSILGNLSGNFKNYGRKIKTWCSLNV